MNKKIRDFDEFKVKNPKQVSCYLDFLLAATMASMSMLFLIQISDNLFFGKPINAFVDVYDSSLLLFLFLTFLFYKMIRFFYINKITKNLSYKLFLNNVDFCNKAIGKVFTTTNTEVKTIRLSQFLEKISNDECIKNNKEDAYYFLMHMDAYSKQLKEKRESEQKKGFLNNLLNK